MMKKFLVRRFLLYSLTIITPCLLFGLVYFGYTTQTLRTQIQEDTVSSLISIRDNVDLVLGSATYQQALLTSNPRLVLSMQKLFQQERMYYEDNVILNTINSIFSSSVNTKLYITSAYFYLDGCERFLSTADGLVAVNSIADAQWLDVYRESDNGDAIWLVERPFRQSVLLDTTSIITVFLRIRSVKGVIAININTSRFGDILDSAQTQKEQLLFLINSDSSVLFSNTNGAAFTKEHALPEMIEQDMGAHNGGLNIVNIDGEDYLYSTLEMADYHILLVSLIRQQDAFRLPNDFISLFIYLTIIFAVLIIGLAYAITKRNFKQIYFILDAFDHGSDSIHAPMTQGLLQNEYDVILHNIVRMHIGSNELKLELAQRELAQKKAEQDALQMQINPHFLFNTFQTLDMEAMSIAGPHNRISAVVGELSSILQYVLGSDEEQVSLADELKYLRSYAAVQSYRYDDKFTFRYEVDPAALSVHVFRLMLQPLVENALYHGINPREGKGVVLVHIWQSEDRLCFRVVDNGVGMSVERLEQVQQDILADNSRSIGMINVNRRLILHYGNESALKISSWEGRGTVVSFWIPFDSKNRIA